MLDTTRTRIKNTMVPELRRITRNLAGVQTIVDSYPSGSGVVSVIDDNNNGLRSKSRSEFVLSDVHITRYIREVTPGSIRLDAPLAQFWRTDVGDLTVFLNLDDPVIPYPITGVDQRAECLISAFAKMHSSPIVTGELVKDLNQTLSMLRRPFSTSLKLIQNVAKQAKKARTARTEFGRFRASQKAVRDAMKATEQAWLEARYGLIPAMMDIDNAIDLSMKVYAREWSGPLVSRAGKSVELNDSVRTTARYAHPEVGCAGVSTASFSSRSSAGVIYKVKPMTSAEQIVAGLGVRPRDILPTLWEMMPYSFVVDWFANVGDWLQAIVPVPGVVPIGWWETIVATHCVLRNGACEYPDPQPAPETVFFGQLGGLKETNFTYERRCNQPLNFTPVLKKNKLSGLHQADALALSCGKIRNALHAIMRR